MSDLNNILTSLQGTSGSVRRGLYQEADLNRDLGSTLEQAQLAKRIQALTDPASYLTSLRDEVKVAEASAKDEFDRLYDAYYKTGVSHEVAQALATQGAKRSYEMYMDSVRISHPESNTGIYSLGSKLNTTTATPFGSLAPADVLGKK
jgi:hypothetical protein